MIRRRDCSSYNDRRPESPRTRNLRRRGTLSKSPTNKTKINEKSQISKMLRWNKFKKKNFVIRRILMVGRVILGVGLVALFFYPIRLFTIFDKLRTNISKENQDVPITDLLDLDILQWYTNERVTAQEVAQKRRQARIKRTMPPILDDITIQQVITPYDYDFIRSDNEKYNTHTGHDDIIFKDVRGGAVTEESLHSCGLSAQEAAKISAALFPSKHIIRNQSVIIISGVLGKLGMNLALKLSSCNLKVIIAVDGMYPNDPPVRLNQLRQLALLYSSLPQVNKPFIMTYDGVNPKASYHPSFQNMMNEMNGELDYSSFSPTHVVHLASAEMAMYNTCDTLEVFNFRQSLIGLEQLLSSFKVLDLNMHFLFLGSNLHSSHEDKRMHTCKTFLQTTQIMEEAMVRYFAEKNLNNTYVTLRIPYVYGPFGKQGLFDYDIANHAANHWSDENSIDSFFKKFEHSSYPSDVPTKMLYVDDVTDAIILAMQFRDTRLNYVSIDLTSETMVSPSEMLHVIKSCMLSNSCCGFQQSEETNALTSRNTLGWTPKWQFDKGIKHLIAWHLDQVQSAGVNTSMIESGSSFLKRTNQTLCKFDDANCLKGKQILPCASECSDPLLCIESPFDDVLEEARRLTEGCDFVIITSKLSKSASKIQIESPDDGECSMAFISKSSSAFAQMSIENRRSAKGRVVENGWTLVFIDIINDKISPYIRYLLKLSPGLFMSDQVEGVLYLSEDSQMNLIQDDIEFIKSLLSKKKGLDYELVESEMNRLKYMKQNEDSEALLLLPTIRKVSPSTSHTDNGSELPFMKKYSFTEVASSILEEDPEKSRHTSKHISFYNQVRAFFNECDFSMDCKYRFKFDPHHWIRPTWVVHNLRNIHARRFRCEWYTEHVKWLDSNDALSFANIMALIQIEKFYDPDTTDDERYEMLIQQNKEEIDPSTDKYQWHEVFDNQRIRTIDLRAMTIERNLFAILKERKNKYKSWKDLLHN